MKDQFGREITYMRVSVTDRCNLRCVYCMPAEGIKCVSHDDILRFDEIVRICRIGAELGISRIKLTGGEPLVRRDLPELVGMLKEIPGIEQVTLTTNGILLKEQINELVSNGLDSVNISLDTLDAGHYRQITRTGRIEEALAGLDAACSLPGLAVRVNCVPLPSSEAEEYIRLALLAGDRRIDVRFIEMMPIGRGKESAGRSGEEILGILSDEFGEPEEVREQVGNGPAAYVRFPGMQGRIGLISAVTHRFCSECNRTRLTSAGQLRLCLQYGTGADIRKLLREGEQDSAIGEVMRKVIREKPSGHCFGEPSPDGEGAESLLETRDMSQIGG